MKKNNYKFLLFGLVIILLFTSCGASNPVNDFFGIKMHPLDEESFKIVGYSVKDGISYKNSIMMDPNLSAWAEITVNDVKLIVQNKTNKDIPLNFNVDEYIIITNEKEYILEKGDRIKYDSKRKIKSNSSFEITLGLPVDYWKTSGGSVSTSYMLKEYSKVGTNLNVVKKNIKYILIKFGHSATIVLKAVPEK